MQMLQGPGNILHIITGNPELGAVFQKTRQKSQVLGPDKTTFGMTFFRPGIRKQQERPVKAGIDQFIQQWPGIVGNHPNIGQAALVNMPQQAANPVHERFRPDNAGLRIGLRLTSQMFAPPKSDFKPQLIGRKIKIILRNNTSLFRIGDPDFWQ